MFVDEALQDHLETSATIRSQSAVIAEWNMNIADNIKQVGNYRYRPTDITLPKTVMSVVERDELFSTPVAGNTVFRITDAGLTFVEEFDGTDWVIIDDSGSPEALKYNHLASSFSVEDDTDSTSKFYYGATDADTVVDGGYSSVVGNEQVSVPTIFQSKKEKEKLLYSLEDCLGRFRPRSGINKLRFFPNRYVHHTNIDMARRPRYYMADKKDQFKYWTSYRTENKVERGISKRSLNKLQIVDVLADGDYATYVIRNPHDVQVGDIVSITNVNPIEYNAQDATVYSVEANSITIEKTFDGAYVSGGTIDLTVNNKYYIDDAAPFVVYENPVPANRLVVKMQTNVGELDLGSFQDGSGEFDDPLYGVDKQTTPVNWKVQYLDNDNWVDAIAFTESSTRRSGLPVIGSDGYVEIAYGLIIPEDYRPTFYYSGEYPSSNLLPDPSQVPNGSAYLVKSSDIDAGTYYINVYGVYESFIAKYGWYLEDSDPNSLTSYATDLTSPSEFFSTSEGIMKYRELQYVGGIRLVVETMNTLDSSFDLIEMSPRLVADLSDKTQGFSVTKNASDLGVSGMPVGQLLASTGTLTLFDYDQAFFTQNVNSVIRDYTSQNITIKLYEIVVDVDGVDYHLPIKTFYSEGFPQTSNADRHVTLTLRDLFFYFESQTAPQLLIQNASVSYAVSLLLDGVGFSNYKFYRTEAEGEMTIPFFTVGPDLSIAQVLSDIAVSSQSAMFFDEYNNFIVMSKSYMMPSLSDRDTDVTLYGSTDFGRSGAYKNLYSNDSVVLKTDRQKLANILELSSRDNKIFNDGQISYTTKYIQKSYSSIKQASMIDKDKTWIYKPSLLWEISGSENTKSVNEEVGQQSNYVLAAVPLNSDLDDTLPNVSNHKIVNNVIDLGDGIYWLARYNGYLYANGEIIKYDAVQYSIGSEVNSATGGQSWTVGDGNTVWISSVQEYQKYFSKVPFNGKLYPTGLVRIYAEPNYEVVEGVTRLKNGAVAKHGRTQFGTGMRNASGETVPVYHNAGLSLDWSGETYLRGCYMDERYLFTTNAPDVSVTSGAAGIDVDSVRSKTTTREGVIKNFLTNIYTEETTLNRNLSTQAGTIQSSALVMNGSATASEDLAPNFLTYVYKPLDDRFKHFGTRMRIVGKVENNATRGQSPTGVSTYYTSSGTTSDQSTAIGGSSGGMAMMLDPNTNNGYYFEIIALTENTTTDYVDSASIHNIVFYKIQKNAAATSSTDKAIPVKLWGGTGSIQVDDGLFTGQYRMSTDTQPTVYDLSAEYKRVGESLKFYLYINNVLVAIVDDPDPLEIRNNMALFVRGSSRVMFENVYALTNNYSQNTTFALDTIHDSAFGDGEINAASSFQKFALSGIIQSTYLSGISGSEPPKYKVYFEEFGTIMREASYFDVRYDKAYPALYAQMAPTYNKIKGYVVSGFRAGAYGAEFLVFNATDSVLSLDSASGNYLRILGITFTQQSQHQLSVDEYFSKTSDLSNPQFTGDVSVQSPLKAKDNYSDIKMSRMTHGKNQFSISASYIQSQDDANSMMGWLASKIMKPRKAVGVKIFAMPTLQLGDIVEIDYKNEDGTEVFQEVANDGTRFVVYSIQYSKDSGGPSMTVFLSEVN